MKNNSLKFNAILNSIRQCCAIIFPLITFPYISRVLGSEGYGKYSYANSITQYFILAATLGVSTYATREGAKIRDDENRIKTFSNEIFTINCITTLISFSLLSLLIIFNSKINNYAGIILIQSLNMVFATVGADWVNNIYEDFLYITVRYIVIQCLALMCMFVFVRNSGDIYPYALITVLATAGGYIMNIFYIRKYVKLRVTKHPHILKHIKPMLMLFANSVAILIYVSADITMLGFFYTGYIPQPQKYTV